MELTIEQITERLNRLGREGVLRSIGYARGLTHDAGHAVTPSGASLEREVLLTRPWYMGGSECRYHVTDSQGARRTFTRSMRQEALRLFYTLCEQEGLCVNA